MAATGGGEWREELDLGDPDAAAFVFQEEPVAGLVVGRIGGGKGVGGESGIGTIIGDRQVEIGGEFGVSGEELGDNFAVAGGDEFRVGVDWLTGNFVIEITAELAGGFGGVVSGLGVVGFGGASEEEVGVGDGDVNGVLLESRKSSLERNGENYGAFVVALTVDVDAVAVESTDVVGEVAPETGEFVAIETANFDGAFGGDVGNGRGGGVRCGEDGRKIDRTTVEDDLVLRVKAGV